SRPSSPRRSPKDLEPSPLPGEGRAHSGRCRVWRGRTGASHSARTARHREVSMIKSFAALAVTVFVLLHGDDRAWAQQHQIEEQVDIMMLQGTGQTGAVAPPMMAGSPDIDFISMPLGLGGETVTGAPYSAEAVTVVAQTLADGNRISRESKAAVYRDTAGRTRREQGLSIIGAMVGGPEDRQQVQITD